MDVRKIPIIYETMGEVARLGLFSDAHIDPEGENKKLKADLKTAADEGCRLHLGGDQGDNIIPADRKRYSRGKDRGDYDAKLNIAVDAQFEIFRPYVDIIDRIGTGNHEESILKHHSYDMTRGLVSLLNHHRNKKLPPIMQGGYRGFVRYHFRGASGGGGCSWVMFQHHGAGGGAYVTGGAIDLNRIASGFGADLYWVGHKHDATIRQTVRPEINDAGNLVLRNLYGILTPGYHESITDDTASIDEYGHVIEYSERFYGGKPQGWGCVTLSIHGENGTKRVFTRVENRG